MDVKRQAAVKEDKDQGDGQEQVPVLVDVVQCDVRHKAEYVGPQDDADRHHDQHIGNLVPGEYQVPEEPYEYRETYGYKCGNGLRFHRAATPDRGLWTLVLPGRGAT